MRLDARTIAFLVILIAVIGGVLFLQNREVDNTDTTEPDTTDEVIDLFEGIDADSVTSLSIVNNDALVTVGEGEDATEEPRTTAYINEDGTWSLDTEASLGALNEPIQSDSVRSAIVSLLTVRSREQFESDDLEQFGLTEPTYIITFDANSETYNLTVGDTNFSGQSYYVQRNDEAAVFLTTNVTGIDGVTNISTTPPYVPTPTPTPQRTLNVPGTVFTTFNTANIVRFSLTDNATGDELVLTREDELSDWVVEDTNLDTEQTTASVIVSEFGSTQGLDTLPAGDDLSVYGLDDPAYTVQATAFNDDTFTLQIGGEDVSGTRTYVLVDDFEQVVTVNKANLDLLITFIENPPLIPATEATPEAEMTDEPMATEEPEAEATEEG